MFGRRPCPDCAASDARATEAQRMADRLLSMLERLQTPAEPMHIPPVAEVEDEPLPDAVQSALDEVAPEGDPRLAIERPSIDAWARQRMDAGEAPERAALRIRLGRWSEDTEDADEVIL